MPPSIYDSIEGGGQRLCNEIAGVADRFPYAGITRFRFNGYDLSPVTFVPRHPQPIIGLDFKDKRELMTYQEKEII